jgi:hypothetical protein
MWGFPTNQKQLQIKGWYKRKDFTNAMFSNFSQDVVPDNFTVKRSHPIFKDLPSRFFHSSQSWEVLLGV